MKLDEIFFMGVFLYNYTCTFFYFTRLDKSLLDYLWKIHKVYELNQLKNPKGSIKLVKKYMELHIGSYDYLPTKVLQFS